MFDDDQAADALRAIAEAPEPPPTTTVDQVIRLGRRRRARRAGAMTGLTAGVVALVTGVAMSSSLFAAPTGVDTAASGAVEPPPLTLSGWTKIDPTTEECDFGSEPPPRMDLPLPSRDSAESALADAVATATGAEYEPVFREWREAGDATADPRGSLTGTVPTETGPAILELYVAGFEGAPDAAAQAQLTRESCLSHYRTVLDDGTVILASDRGSPNSTSADLEIYVPGGRHLLLQGLSGMSAPSDVTGERVTINDAVSLPVPQVVEIGYELSQAGL